MTGPIFTALMGAWLYLSAILWARSPVQFALTAGCGVATVVFAYLSGRVTGARYATVAVGGLAFLLGFAFYRWGSPAYWNSVIVGISIAAGGLFTGGPASIQHERELYGHA